MSAGDYPTLSINPAYPLEEQREKTGIVTRSEYGYVHGRVRYTMARMTYVLSYPLLSGADKSLLEDHVAAADIAETFTWTHPWTRLAYVCRYAEIPKFALVHGGDGWWQTSVTLQSVRPSDIDLWGVSGDAWGDPEAPPIDIWGGA